MGALSWASPAHYPHDGEFQRLHAETHLWQTYVVYGANALGAMFVVCATWCCERDQDVPLEEEADFMKSPTLSVHDLVFFKDYLETEIEMEMVDLHPSVKLVSTGACEWTASPSIKRCCERDQDVPLEEEADFMKSPTLSVHDWFFLRTISKQRLR